jgi:hypothetical protein
VDDTRADDTDVDDAFDFPADRLQMQRELDAARREFVRWPPCSSWLGAGEQQVIDALWATQSELVDAVAGHSFRRGAACGRRMHQGSLSGIASPSARASAARCAADGTATGGHR